MHVGSAQNNLEVPSEQPGSGELLNRTPARRSYLPVIPSPLLKVRSDMSLRENLSSGFATR